MLAEPAFDKIQCCFTDSKERRPLNKLDIRQAYSATVKKTHSWAAQAFLVLLLHMQYIKNDPLYITHTLLAKIDVYLFAYLMFYC